MTMTTQLSTHTLLERLGHTLEEILNVERHMLKRLEGIEAELIERAGGSSIEIDSNGKAGETKIKVKRYADSETPVSDAIADYTTAMAHIADGHMAGWQETLTELERRARSS